MKRRWAVIFCGAVAVMAGAIFWWLGSAPVEPMVEGRPIGYWIEEFANDGKDQAMAIQTLGKLGKEAVPHVIAKRKERDTFWCRLYRDHWSSLPGVVRRRFEKPRPPKVSDVSAGLILFRLGRPAIPAIAAHLRDRHEGVRLSCLHALHSFASGRDGKETVGPFLPALIQASGAKEAAVRNAALYVLANLRLKLPPVAVPLLIRLLDDNDRRHGNSIRWLAASILGQCGADGKAAVPALVRVMNTSIGGNRVEAAKALWRIDQRTSDTVPVLLEELKRDRYEWEQETLSDNGGKVGAVFAVFGEMGPAAAAAVPVLIRALQPPIYHPSVAFYAGQALKAIDAEAAAKAGVK